MKLARLHQRMLARMPYNCPESYSNAAFRIPIHLSALVSPGLTGLRTAVQQFSDNM